MAKTGTLEHLFLQAAENPHLARQLKKDPVGAASIYGIELSEPEAEQIRKSLDVDELVKFATEAHAMAAKVAQGVGLKLE